MKRLFFDTETTGLPKVASATLDQQPRIIEFYGRIEERPGKALRGFHSLFKVGKPLPPRITEITGIKDEDLKGQPTFREQAEALKEFIESADLVVAHNLAFDFSLVNFDMERAGVKLDWPDGLCTVEASEHLVGHRLSLQKLHTHLFGMGFANAHRAEVDVNALADCYWKLHELGEV